MTSINNASRASCIQEVKSMNNTTSRFKEHDVYKRQHSSLFSSSTITRDMISRNVNPNHTNYMQEYTSLRFGPQTTKPFNIFVGQGLNHNKFPITQTSGRYKYMPQSQGYSIATSSRRGDEMTEGRFPWDDIHLSTRKNCSIAYDTATTDYEAGLLLDCDRGTLDYYHKGMYIRTLSDGLMGGYVWVIQFSRKKGTQITEFRTNTY